MQCSNLSRIGDQAHSEHDLCQQRWSAGYPQAAPGACSQMVSPLPTAPWTHMSQRDMNAAMYWKGMHTTLWSLTKSC